jgi:hypothetical protein
MKAFTACVFPSITARIFSSIFSSFRSLVAACFSNCIMLKISEYLCYKKINVRHTIIPMWEDSAFFAECQGYTHICLIPFTLVEYDIAIRVIKSRILYSTMTGVVKKSYTMRLNGELISFTQGNELQTFRGHLDLRGGRRLGEQISVDSKSISVLRRITVLYHIYFDGGWNRSNTVL